MKNSKNQGLTFLVKSFYDYQKMRIRMEGRLRKKKDGEDQKDNPKTDYTNVVEEESDNKIVLEEVYKETEKQEDFLLKRIKETIKIHPLWKAFLKDVKGCGELMAAVIISQFNIYLAENVSKMIAYSGMSPGTTFGKKWNKSKTKIITTDVLVKQDRKTPGFLCPYNAWLKSKMLGVLASGFLKANSLYKKFYDDYKNRMENLSEEEKKKRLKKSKNPSDKKRPYAGHIHRMALRYMMKIFLKDLYVAWRTLEGLSVRNFYEEEYLKREHSE